MHELHHDQAERGCCAASSRGPEALERNERNLARTARELLRARLAQRRHRPAMREVRPVKRGIWRGGALVTLEYADVRFASSARLGPRGRWARREAAGARSRRVREDRYPRGGYGRTMLWHRPRRPPLRAEPWRRVPTCYCCIRPCAGEPKSRGSDSLRCRSLRSFSVRAGAAMTRRPRPIRLTHACPISRRSGRPRGTRRARRGRAPARWRRSTPISPRAIRRGRPMGRARRFARIPATGACNDRLFTDEREGPTAPSFGMRTAAGGRTWPAV